METRKPTIDDMDDPDDEDGQIVREAKQDNDLKLRKKDPDYVTLDDTVSAGIDEAGTEDVGDDAAGGGAPGSPRPERPRIDLRE